MRERESEREGRVVVSFPGTVTVTMNPRKILRQEKMKKKAGKV